MRVKEYFQKLKTEKCGHHGATIQDLIDLGDAIQEEIDGPPAPPATMSAAEAWHGEPIGLPEIPKGTAGGS